MGSGPRFRWAVQRWASVAVVGGTAASEGGAASAPDQDWGQLVDAGVEDHVSFSSVAALFESSSKSAESFSLDFDHELGPGQLLGSFWFSRRSRSTST